MSRKGRYVVLERAFLAAQEQPCNYCGTAVLWIKVGVGRATVRMPVDVSSAEAAPADDHQRRRISLLSHWFTCPDAARVRRDVKRRRELRAGQRLFFPVE